MAADRRHRQLPGLVLVRGYEYVRVDVRDVLRKRRCPHLTALRSRENREPTFVRGLCIIRELSSTTRAATAKQVVCGVPHMSIDELCTTFGPTLPPTAMINFIEPVELSPTPRAHHVLHLKFVPVRPPHQQQRKDHPRLLDIDHHKFFSHLPSPGFTSASPLPGHSKKALGNVG